MSLKETQIGVAFTGSFCTYKKAFLELQKLSNCCGSVQTVFSTAAASTDSRFGSAESFYRRAEEITGNKPMMTISEAEPIGPKILFDALVILPCTGNTLAKLANGITDTPALMAAKAHLRNNKPLLLSLSTNDALGMNMKNIGLLLNTKNIYFVPICLSRLWKPLLRTGSFSLSYAILSKNRRRRIFYVRNRRIF